MRYFTPDEFKCNCGCGLDVEQQVKSMIEEARHIAQVPFIITSGARCLDYNYKIKSRPTSSHIKGLAVDILTETSRDRFIITKALMQVGFTRLGFNFDDEFIHVDLDREKPQQLIFGY